MLDTLRKLSYLLSRRERWEGTVLFLSMLVGAVLEVAGVGAIPLFVAAVSKPERIYQIAALQRFLVQIGSPSPRQLVIDMGLGLVVLFVVKNLYLAFLLRHQAKFSSDRQVSIATRLFRAYLYSPYTFHLQRNTAELLRNIDSEAFTIATALFQVVNLMMEICVLSLMMGLLLIVEPVVTVAAGVLFGAIVVLFHRLARARVKRMSHHEQVHHASTIRTVNQGLGGIKDVKILGRERYFIDMFARSAEERAVADRQKTVFINLPRLFIETLGVLGMFAATTIMYLRGRSPDLIISTLALLAVVVVRLMPSFQRLANALAVIRWGETSLGVVTDDLQELEHSAVAAEAVRTDVRITSTWSHLDVDHVDYTYPKMATPALADIALRIERGAAVGLVGVSGAGKSTLVDILLGLIEPSRGRVLVDTEDIALDLRGWQRQIGYVPQQIFLTDDTIRRNVAFGLDDAAIDTLAVERAIAAAHLTEFIGTLPDGLDTIVGERGVRLSGGQRQRIGIARALYHEPTVLLMDEATSALDNRTERYIVEAIESMRGSYTVVIIAHRLSTVRNCDRLYVMKEGRLVASGSYDELREQSHDFRTISA